MFVDYSKEKKYLTAIPCGNCGKFILPGSNIGVSYGRNRQEIVIFHALKADCIPPGNFYDGFWSEKGEITFYDKVEKC